MTNKWSKFWITWNTALALISLIGILCGAAGSINVFAVFINLLSGCLHYQKLWRSNPNRFFQK